MAGASVLAARACMRSGVGKLTVHIPRRNNDILQISIPEAIIQHDRSDTMFTEASDLSAYDALAVGPGLGTDETTANAVFEQLEIAQRMDVPTVVDADALNILSQHPDWWSVMPERTIITPHPGELKRLTDAGISTDNVVLVKKGHPTTIIGNRELRNKETKKPSGTLEPSETLKHAETFICPYGNCGMATAGSGDVLTGIILGLLAQGYSTHDAAVLGVSLHALSGDLATKALGCHSMIASDIIEHLGEAFMSTRVRPQSNQSTAMARGFASQQLMQLGLWL